MSDMYLQWAEPITLAARLAADDDERQTYGFTMTLGNDGQIVFGAQLAAVAHGLHIASLEWTDAAAALLEDLPNMEAYRAFAEHVKLSAPPELPGGQALLATLRHGRENPEGVAAHGHLARALAPEVLRPERREHLATAWRRIGPITD